MALIPVIIGVLFLIEGALPYRHIDTVVVSKHSSFRIKTGTTTYSIRFNGLNEQFTEEIFEALEQNDSVRLEVSYFSMEVNSLTRIADGAVFQNDTSEWIFHYIFAIVFLLVGLSWFKTGDLRKREAIFVFIMILMSLISGGRMIVLHYF